MSNSKTETSITTESVASESVASEPLKEENISTENVEAEVVASEDLEIDTEENENQDVEKNLEKDNISEENDEDEEDVELWNDEQTKSAIEALLFVADEPLTKRELANLVGRADKATINRAISQLSLEYEGAKGIHLSEIDNGFQFRTNPDLSSIILRMYEAKPLRLSKAILETLAIVAYQQPATKARVDEIRGVDCSGSLKKLLGFDLISIIGRADDIGRPNLYATTTRFLEFFGLKSITEMPTLEEFEVDALELVGEDLREFLPEDDRESILAEHVAVGEIEREERQHELGDGPGDEDSVDEDSVDKELKKTEVLASSAVNDDGVRVDKDSKEAFVSDEEE